jgi:monoamine oxidase
MTRRRALATITASSLALAQNRPKVVVIGAGIAGLAAAQALRQKKIPTVVLEASSRVGGRVFTDTSLGIPLDLGASWLHGTTDNPIAQLAIASNITSQATDYRRITRYGPDGQVVEMDDSWLNSLLARAMSWGERQSIDRSLRDGLNHALGNLRLSTEGRKNLEYLINVQIEHEYAADVEQLSLWHWNSGRVLEGADVIFPLGFSQITQKLAEGLDIRLHQTVGQIRQTGSRVVVQTQDTSLEADYAVLTVPLGVLKRSSIRFSPPLPEGKQQAIQRLGMGLLNKLYLQFPEVFWENTDLLGYVSETRGQWAEWLNLHKLIRQPVLLGFNAGSYARYLEARSDAQTVQDALSVLRRIYRQAPRPTAFRLTRWGQNPHSWGSYSYLAIGSRPQDRPILAAPFGQIHFAGEATSKNFAATVHGAYQSGVTAAQQILDRL